MSDKINPETYPVKSGYRYFVTLHPTTDNNEYGPIAITVGNTCHAETLAQLLSFYEGIVGMGFGTMRESFGIAASVSEGEYVTDDAGAVEPEPATEEDADGFSMKQLAALVEFLVQSVGEKKFMVDYGITQSDLDQVKRIVSVRSANGSTFLVPTGNENEWYSNKYKETAILNPLAVAFAIRELERDIIVEFG